MRLLKIEIEGITSLKDKVVIDFDKDLEGEDLFAITGPTGSGKSTILNCISIALYYKSHKDLNPEDFVSLGAKRGKIALDFEMNGDKYTSIWECSLYGVRGKKLKDPKPIKEFYKNGISLDTKIHTPESVIGLDEDQFQKTVIINQGRFSDFITSPFKDRKILLEKIYTTENITSFPSFLNKEISKLNDEKALLESTLKGGLPITKDQYEQNVTRESEIKKENTTLEGQRNYVEVVFNNVKDIVENASKINDSKEDIARVKVNLNQISEELIAIDNTHKKAERELESQESAYKLALPEIEKGLKNLSRQLELEKSLDKNTKTIEENSITLDTESKRIESLQEELSKSQEQLDQLLTETGKPYSRDEVQILDQYVNELSLLLNEEKNLKTNVDELKKRLKESEEKGKNLKADIDLYLTKNDINSDPNAEENLLNEEIAKLSDKIGAIKLSAHRIEDWNKENLELSEQIDKLESTEKILQKKCSKINDDLRNTENKIELNKKEILLNEALLAINKCIEIAHDKKECPVCGSNELSKLSEIGQDLSDSSVLLSEKEKLEVLYNEDVKKLTEFQIKKQNNLNELLESQKKIEDIHQKANKELSLYNYKDIPFSKMSLKLKELEKNITEELEFKREKLKLAGQHKTNLKLMDQGLNTERLRYGEIKSDLEKAKNQLSIISNSKTTSIDKITSITGYKENFDLELSKKTIKIARNIIETQDDLSSKTKLVNNINEQILRLRKQINTALEENKAYEAEIENLKSEHSTILKNLKVNDLDGLKKSYEKSIREAQDNKNAILKELHTVQLKKGQLSTQIQYKEENIESLENLVLKYLKNLSSRSFPQNASNEMTDIESKVEKIASHEKAHFEAWELENISGFHDDVLSYHFHALKEKAEALKEEAVEIRTLNTSYLSKVAEFEKISIKISSIDRKLEAKQKIKDVIGRDEFTRYAISMIEEQLILMTNKELEQLCDGRYVLFQEEKNKTKGPEFFIKDLWRSSSERPLQSLSGGETFMVSLAMALGLAEMARGQTEIDTFFIDEGFGTLDQDSLEEVLNILMSIRSRGKQIGIISHVKELTDRLPIRIQLQKNQLGESHLEISTF